jgi:ABC-2 type transport system ATP-binding protein
VPLVEIESVRKSYDSFVAVNDLSLRIPPGQIYGLLGPNGAGKTSTIRMMIGITLPDAGSVRLFGEPFRRAHLDRVGYLPEERGLYKRMKVIEQLVFLGQVHGLSAAEATLRARRWCERLELSDWTERKVEELSKGMQQKVQFIAALLHDPDLVIMDEPFSGMDPVNTVKMKDILLELKQRGKTVLFSTHRSNTLLALFFHPYTCPIPSSFLPPSTSSSSSSSSNSILTLSFIGNTFTNCSCTPNCCFTKLAVISLQYKRP